MRHIWFKTLPGVLIVAGLGGAALLAPQQAAAYQDGPTPTGIFVTVVYSDPINIRGGPSTLIYPIVGQLAPGSVVPALGVSPGRDWILISYADGTGWVLNSPVYISVSGGELRPVEPPPTPSALPTSTIDPTFAAAFNIQPTPTHMPTFTPPPPLVVPHFTEVAGGVGPSGGLILSLGLIGGFGLLVSYLLRK